MSTTKEIKEEEKSVIDYVFNIIDFIKNNKWILFYNKNR